MGKSDVKINTLVSRYKINGNGANDKVNTLVSAYNSTHNNNGSILGYSAANVGIGLAGIFEGLGDFVGGTYYQLIGDKDYAKYLHMNDVTGGWKERLDKNFNPSSTVKVLGDISSGIGQAIPTVALGVATGGGSLAVQAAGAAAMGAAYAGRGVTSAVQQTGELGFKENAYGVLSGSLEGVTDMFLGGTVKAGKALITTARQSAKVGAKKIARTTLLKGTLSAAASEAAEEFIQEYADTALLRLTGVNKEAEYSFGNAAYSAFIGGITGGFLGGITNGINTGVNLKIGQDLQQRGLADQVLNTADYVRDVHIGNSKNYSNITSESLRALTASVDAYRGLNAEAKAGTKGAVILGEIKQELLAFESAAGVDAIKTRMMDGDEQTRKAFATEASKLFGKQISAEDIKTNAGGITERLALESFVSGALADNQMETSRAQMNEAIAAERLPYLNSSEAWNGEGAAAYRDPKSGKYIFVHQSEDGNWRMAYSPTAIYDENNLMVKDGISTEDVKKTLAGLRDGSMEIGQNGIRPKGVIEPDVVKTFANNKQGRKAKKEYKRQVKADQRNAIVSANQEKMLGEAIVNRKSLADGEGVATDTAQEAREGSQTGESVSDKEVNASEAEKAAEREIEGKEAVSDTSDMTENERKRGYTDKEADTARKILRDFDMLSREKRLAIIEMMRSAKECGASESFMRHAASMIGYWRKGLYILADSKTSEKGFYQAFGDGSRLIVVNPTKAKSGAKSAIDTAFVHELAHDIWEKATAKTKDALYRLATEGATAAEVEDIRTEYENGYKARGLKHNEELLREEVFTNLMGKTLGNERFLERFDITPGRMTAFKRGIKAVTRMAKCFVGKDRYLYSRCEKMARAFIRAMGEEMVNDVLSSADAKRMIDSTTRTFSYNELISKPDMEVTVIKNNQQVKMLPNGSIDVDDIYRTVKNQCKSIEFNAKEPTYYVNVPEIGKNVEISNKGILHGMIKHTTTTNSTKIKKVGSSALENSRVFLRLPDIISQREMIRLTF